jgi:hypothetical protein
MRTALTIMVLSTLLLFNSCENPLETNEIRIVDGISFQLITDKKEYYLPDTLNIKIVINNLSGIDKTFNFFSSCHLGFKLMTSDNPINFPQACLGILTSLTVNAGETKEVEVKYMLERFRGLISGKDHQLEAFLMDNNSPVLSAVLKFF